MTKFQEKVNALLQKHDARIVADVKLDAKADLKLIQDRFEKLKEEYGISVAAEIRLTVDNWGVDIKKENEV